MADGFPPGPGPPQDGEHGVAFLGARDAEGTVYEEEGNPGYLALAGFPLVGADLVSVLHSDRKDLLEHVVGGTEETTTGVIRLMALRMRSRRDPRKQSSTIVAETNAEDPRLSPQRPLGAFHLLGDVWEGRPRFRVCFKLAHVLFGPRAAMG